jgi:hypothetical protein
MPSVVGFDDDDDDDDDESNTDRVEISKLLRKWSAPDGFLKREGKPPKVSYSLR